VVEAEGAEGPARDRDEHVPRAEERDAGFEEPARRIDLSVLHELRRLEHLGRRLAVVGALLVSRARRRGPPVLAHGVRGRRLRLAGLREDTVGREAGGDSVHESGLDEIAAGDCGLVVTRAGRLTRIGGRHVRRLAHNPAFEALHATTDHRLAARVIVGLGLGAHSSFQISP